MGALTVLITVEVAVVCTYVQLCAEDYNWWYNPARHPQPACSDVAGCASMPITLRVLLCSLRRTGILLHVGHLSNIGKGKALHAVP